MYNPVTYYRAEVYLDAKRVAKMYGKHNSRQDLDAFLEQAWPGDMGYHTVEPYEQELILKIYRYHGSRLDCIWKTARMPRPADYLPGLAPFIDTV